MKLYASFMLYSKIAPIIGDSLAEPDPLPNRLRGERVWSNSHQRFVSPSQQISKLYGHVAVYHFCARRKKKKKKKKQLQDMDQIINECARAYGLIL